MYSSISSVLLKSFSPLFIYFLKSIFFFGAGSSSEIFSKLFIKPITDGKYFSGIFDASAIASFLLQTCQKNFLCYNFRSVETAGGCNSSLRFEGGLAFPEEKFRKEVRCMRWKIIVRVIVITVVVLHVLTKVAA